jgi:hypothetical protein
MGKENVTRRVFLKGMTFLCGSSVAGISSLTLWTDTAEAVDAEAGYIEEETMKAFADTIIPGPNSDPEGSVGGVEAGALAVMYDPYYGLKPFMGLLTRNLNRTSIWWYGKLFKDLDLRQRTAIVLFKDHTSLIKLTYEQAENLVKLAFYGAIINDVGTHYISFPGPSLGYDDYYFSDDEMCAKKATEDGNLP